MMICRAHDKLTSLCSKPLVDNLDKLSGNGSCHLLEGRQKDAKSHNQPHLKILFQGRIFRWMSPEVRYPSHTLIGNPNHIDP
jgi:hypothetical protein